MKKVQKFSVDSQVSLIEIVQECRFGFTLEKVKAIVEALMLQNLLSKYVYICHDKDSKYDSVTHKPIEENGVVVAREPHIHLYLQFTKKTRISQILKLIEPICGTMIKSRTVGSGVDAQTIDEEVPVVRFEQCQKIKGGWCAAIAYSVHANAPYKHQYGRDEVFSNYDFGKDIDDYMSDVDEDAFLVELQKGILDRTIRRCDLRRYFEGREVLYPRLEPKIEKWFKLRDLESPHDRLLDVIFVTGGSGCGKSTFAKEDAKLRGYSICEASSGKNSLDDYQEQDAFILSEFRGKGWTQGDLLMFLDNHTAAKQKARYHNVDFSFCKAIYVCSTRSLDEIWADTDSFDNSEQRFQLKRRIIEVVEMADDVVTVDHFHDGKYLKSEKFPNRWGKERFKDAPIRYRDYSMYGAVSYVKSPASDFKPVADSDDLTLIFEPSVHDSTVYEDIFE